MQHATPQINKPGKRCSGMQTFGFCVLSVVMLCWQLDMFVSTEHFFQSKQIEMAIMFGILLATEWLVERDEMYKYVHTVIYIYMYE